jgi:hypothetical protein
VVEQFYAHRYGLHKGLEPPVSRFFDHPQFIHRAPGVLPRRRWFVHQFVHRPVHRVMEELVEELQEKKGAAGQA